MQKTYNNIINGIKQYFNQNNINKAVIGLSGGIDSALSLKLVADAIGNKNIVAWIMPEKGLTKKSNVDDSINLCNLLKIEYNILPINSFLKNFNNLKQNKISWINLKPRVRAIILYNQANLNNALVIGTSNKTELKLGYFTKYGDGACDLEVIGSLYKTKVWQLSKFLKLPEEIINKKPTAELYPGHSDESEIGLKYSEIDDMLKGKKKLSLKLKKLIDKNKHKTCPVPIIKK